MRISSPEQMARAIRHASDISVDAYQLPKGDVLGALYRAASRGAHVRVRLEGDPFPDRKGGLLRYNTGIVRRLKQSGADAKLSDTDGQVPLHAKAAWIDGALYVDDVNFARGGTLLHLGAREMRNIAWLKSRALQREAKLLENVRSRNRVEVESESIGRGNEVYCALERLGDAGLHPRLLVSRRAATEKERHWLQCLERHRVEVRMCDSNEKFALADGSTWIGSANATSWHPKPQTIDWSLCSKSRALIADLRRNFETRWQHGKPVIG
jgi:hypothetical protein